MNWQQAREELLKNDAVRNMIAERAYHISESRSFTAGHEAEDWFRAENEVLEYLLRKIESDSGKHGATEETVLRASDLIESAIHEEPVSPIEVLADSQAEKEKKSGARKRSSETASAKTKSASAKKATTKSAAEKSAPKKSRAKKTPEASTHAGD